MSGNNSKFLGLGLDMVDIADMRDSLRSPSFLRRVYTAGEIMAISPLAKDSVYQYAERFALKEAVMKALGSGINQGVWFRSIEIVKVDNHFDAYLFGTAAVRAFDLGINNWQLCSSITSKVVVAVAVALSW
jgi:holo-[acyl-carrier protein] synthase